MILGPGIAGVFKVVGLFLERKVVEQLADRRIFNGSNGACASFAQQILELGKDVLDGVQVGRLFRQKN